MRSIDRWLIAAGVLVIIAVILFGFEGRRITGYVVGVEYADGGPVSRVDGAAGANLHIVIVETATRRTWDKYWFAPPVAGNRSVTLYLIKTRSVRIFGHEIGLGSNAAKVAIGLGLDSTGTSAGFAYSADWLDTNSPI